MKFDDLEKTWSQQAIVPRPLFAHSLSQLLANEVRQRTRSARRVVRVALFMFVVTWSVALVAHSTGIRPFDTVTLVTLVAGSVYDLVFFALACLSLRRMREEAANFGQTLLKSVQGSLSIVERQLRDCARLINAMPVGFAVGVLSFAVSYSKGNLPLRGLVLGTVGAAAFLCVAATLRRYQSRELLPRREELRQQMAALEE